MRTQPAQTQHRTHEAWTTGLVWPVLADRSLPLSTTFHLVKITKLSKEVFCNHVLFSFNIWTINVCILKCQYKCIVIYKLIYVVRFEYIQCIEVWVAVGDFTVAIDGNKMSTVHNGVNMNNRIRTRAISIEIRFNNPHSSLIVWVISNMWKPTN